MSGYKDVKKHKATGQLGKPYSVYWKTSAGHSRSTGPMKAAKGQSDKGGQKENRDDSDVKRRDHKAQQPTLRELCPADKQRVRKLIEQVAVAGSEREKMEGEIKEERKQFGELLKKLRNQYQKVVKEKTDLQGELQSSQLQLQSMHTHPATQNDDKSDESLSSLTSQPTTLSQGQPPKLLNIESILSMPSGPLNVTGTESSARDQTTLSAAHLPSSLQSSGVVRVNHNLHSWDSINVYQTTHQPRASTSVSPSETHRSSATLSSLSTHLPSGPVPLPVAPSHTPSLVSPRHGVYVQAQYPHYFTPSAHLTAPSHPHTHHHDVSVRLPYNVQPLPPPSMQYHPPLSHTQGRTQLPSMNTPHLKTHPQLDYSVSQLSSSINTSTLNSSQLPHHILTSTQVDRGMEPPVLPHQVYVSNSPVASGPRGSHSAVPLHRNSEMCLTVTPHPDVKNVSTCTVSAGVDFEEQTRGLELSRNHGVGETEVPASPSVKCWHSLPVASPEKKATQDESLSEAQCVSVSFLRDVCTQTINVESVATQTVEERERKGVKDPTTSGGGDFVTPQVSDARGSFVSDVSVDTSATVLSVSDLQGPLPTTTQSRGCNTRDVQGPQDSTSGPGSDLHVDERLSPSKPQISNSQTNSQSPTTSSGRPKSSEAPVNGGVSERDLETGLLSNPLSEGGSGLLLEELLTSALLNAQGTLTSLRTLSKFSGSVVLEHNRMGSTFAASSSSHPPTATGSVERVCGESVSNGERLRGVRSPSPLELAESLNPPHHTLSLLTDTSGRSHDCSIRSHDHTSHQDHVETYLNHQKKHHHTRLQEPLYSFTASDQGSMTASPSPSRSESGSNCDMDESELIQDLFFI